MSRSCSSVSSYFSPENSRRNSTVVNNNITPVTITKVYEALTNIHNFDFNIFEVNDLLEKRTLFHMAFEIFSRLNYFDSLMKEDTFKSFISAITDGYNRKVAYHNDLHGADCFQTMYVMFETGNISKLLQLKEIDVLACLISAICHDFKHPGQNNLFQINSKSDIAIVYNGKIYK